jgi:hypothetical protein
MCSDEQPTSTWLDAEESARWARAVEEIARRERIERGVNEPYSVTSEFGALWVNYGALRVRVAGGEEVWSEKDLYEHVDRWVAFERNGGAWELLDRDREFMDQWRAGLPEEQALWQEAAVKVFRDIQSTTNLRWTGRVAIHGDQEIWPLPPPGSRAGIWIRPGGEVDWKSGRRRLLLPQLWLDSEQWRTLLPRGVVNLPDAIAKVVNQVQDKVMDEAFTIWPPCPEHGHPLMVVRSPRPAWVCPATRDEIAAVGELRQGLTI